jgi:predicted RNA-binding Zn-ribbon protein involved in translation (DUF1610 family)
MAVDDSLARKKKSLARKFLLAGTSVAQAMKISDLDYTTIVGLKDELVPKEYPKCPVCGRTHIFQDREDVCRRTYSKRLSCARRGQVVAAEELPDDLPNETPGRCPRCGRVHLLEVDRKLCWRRWSAKAREAGEPANEEGA